MMRVRRLKRETDDAGNILRHSIVFFGSYGVNADGTAKFYNKNNKYDNFADKQEAVADSLTQRLNVLQGELWYKVNDGWPLWDNHKNTVILDAYVSSTVLAHPDVISIATFNSSIKHPINEQFLVYNANIVINSVYGMVNFGINQRM